MKLILTFVTKKQKIDPTRGSVSIWIAITIATCSVWSQIMLIINLQKSHCWMKSIAMKCCTWLSNMVAIWTFAVIDTYRVMLYTFQIFCVFDGLARWRVNDWKHQIVNLSSPLPYGCNSWTIDPCEASKCQNSFLGISFAAKHCRQQDISLERCHHTDI